MRTALVALVAVLLVTASTPRASAQVPVLRGSLVSNGGGVLAGPGFSLVGAVGQPAVGFGAGGGAGACSGFWCLGGLAVVGVAPDPDTNGAPIAFAFGGAVPNPTRGETTFQLALPRAGRVRLEAFDVAGRLLGAAVDKELSAGRYALHWNAAHTAPGVYFTRLLVDGQVRARRQLVVVR